MGQRTAAHGFTQHSQDLRRSIGLSLSFQLSIKEEQGAKLNSSLRVFSYLLKMTTSI
ncbi:hypothetical protein CCACVL1_04565 [Corchorus capsularis]|uniref:Uncharacterized protein n=1 Tax=Corchorus capsularis TaxID=210143 RepID=A0A1R3JRI6_COCAP|nr:hypothetical protein CCACVL1_04565 [Corchorus capsularis]